MKRQSVLWIISMLFMVFDFWGCLDLKVHTSISSDGSCDRTITVRRDSRSLPDAAFPIPKDSTWSTEWKQVEIDSPKYEYTARKHFAALEELEREYASRPDTARLQIRVNVKKSFQWFYTYFRYRETYTLRNFFTRIPITSALTEEEIRKYQNDGHSDSLKKKVDTWCNRNMFEEFFVVMAGASEKNNDPALPASFLRENKEKLFTALFIDSKKKSDSSENGRTTKDGEQRGNFQSSGDSSSREFDEGLAVMAGVLGTDAVYKLRNDLLITWKRIDRELAGQVSADGNYTNSAQLPGLILGTNSSTLEGNSVSWSFSAEQLRVGAFTMEAESRVVNFWAFIVTGAAAAGLLFLLILRYSFKRPKMVR